MFSHLFKSADTHTLGLTDIISFLFSLERISVARSETTNSACGSIFKQIDRRGLGRGMVAWRNVYRCVDFHMFADAICCLNTSGCASPFETRLKTLNMILHLKVWNNFLLAFSKVINQQRGVVELPKDWQDRVGMGNGLTADALIAHVHGQSRGHHTRVKDRLFHV